jgi:hypothetical protein
VYHDLFPRSVLYTWTTSAQVDELRRTRILLSKTRSATKGTSFFDQRRREHPWSEAVLFDEPALARRRFAWGSPWPTVRGLDARETYGDRLIRVTLKPGAILAYFGGKDHSWWSYFDLQGRPVSFSEMVAHPQRIAGVFHVFDGEGEHPSYREFVLCNESMIQAWEIDTPEIRADLAVAIDVLRRLQASIQRDPPDPAAMEAGMASIPREVWPARPENPSLAALYEANLAFPGAHYRLDLETLDAITAALLAVPSGPPLRHEPDVRFPGFTEGAYVRRSTGPEYNDGFNRLPSVVPRGWRHAVKCMPVGSYGCSPFGEP